jgi:hypothetical protein
VSLTRPQYSLRFNWNYRGERRTAAVTGVGLPADNFTWMPSRLTLDAQADYTFRKRYAVFVILRNATNVPEDNRIYNSLTPSVARFRNRIDYGALWTFGVKGSF